MLLPRALVITPDVTLRTDGRVCDADAATLISRVALFLEAGALVQLRMKALEHRHNSAVVEEEGDAPFLAIVRRAASLSGARERLVVNADAAVARACGVGVHLTGDRLMSSRERPLPRGFVVGASCHDETQACAAVRAGCDYAVISPVRQSVSCPTEHPLGWDGFGRVVAAAQRTAAEMGVDCPLLYALGGVGPGDASRARSHGAHGIAAISAFWQADEPLSAVSAVARAWSEGEQPP